MPQSKSLLLLCLLTLAPRAAISAPGRLTDSRRIRIAPRGGTGSSSPAVPQSDPRSTGIGNTTTAGELWCQPYCDVAPNRTWLQAQAEHFTAGARRLLVNLSNKVKAGSSKAQHAAYRKTLNDKDYKKTLKMLSLTEKQLVRKGKGKSEQEGCPVHIVLLWPKVGKKNSKDILQQLHKSTPGLRMLRVSKFEFPDDEDRWAKCHAKFYGRNQPPERQGIVKKQWSDPDIVHRFKGFGEVLAAVMAVDCTQARWQDAPGTEGTHDAAMGKLKVRLRKKYDLKFALHASDDPREAQIDVQSFFGDSAYDVLMRFRDAGGKWDGSTIGKGSAGCPVPGPKPRVQTADEKEENRLRKAREAKELKAAKEQKKQEKRAIKGEQMPSAFDSVPADPIASLGL